MKLRGLFLALALTVLLLPQSARATTVYYLNIPNANLSGLTPPYQTPFATVTITLENPTTATISVVAASDYKIVGNQGAFGVNVNAASFTNSSITYGPSTGSNLVEWGGPKPKQMDGLGDFNDVFDGPQPGDKDGKKPIIIQDLSFNLINTSGKTWADSDDVLIANSNKMVAVAHLSVLGSTVTGFAGADPPVNPPAHAPVPSTFLLLGSGLLALVVRLRRR